MSEVVGIEVSFSGVDGEGSCLRDRTSHGTRLSAVPYETPCYFEFLAGGEGIGVARAFAAGIIAQLARSALTPVCPSLLSVRPGRGNSILALQLSGASDEPGLG